MKTEIEVKFINIDIDDIRRRLEHAGGPMRLMRRVVIEQPQHTADNSFLRIRDEGDKVTLTFKRRAADHTTKIEGVEEIEVIVSDFDKTVEIFREAGWGTKTFQESKRETWTLDDTEIVIDEWPWMPPYIEIEGADEMAVRTAAEALGLSWSDANYGHIDAVYEEYYSFDGVRGVIDLPEVRFSDPVPKEFIPKLNK